MPNIIHARNGIAPQKRRISIGYGATRIETALQEFVNVCVCAVHTRAHAAPCNEVWFGNTCE